MSSCIDAREKFRGVTPGRVPLKADPALGSLSLDLLAAHARGAAAAFTAVEGTGRVAADPQADSGGRAVRGVDAKVRDLALGIAGLSAEARLTGGAEAPLVEAVVALFAVGVLLPIVEGALALDDLIEAAGQVPLGAGGQRQR